MSQFEELFANEPDLRTSKNKDARYHWIIVRLDFASDGSGGRKLVLGATPSPEEEEIGVPSSLGTGRMTYAERQRLRYETERLDEKRAQNIAAKSDKARKAFLADLQERRKLEQLKAAARQKRIEEERAERREARALQKRLKEDKSALYRTNEEKRTQAIALLEKERAVRDEKRIRKVMEEDRERKYLVARQQAIDELSKQKQLKAERKAQYLYQKSAERAKRLKEDHEKAAEWERLEDQRTQAELKREHDRNMMMLSHIADLKQRKAKEDAEMRMKKESALERRRLQEKQALDQVAEGNRRKAEIDEKRARAIATREAAREQRNQEYVEQIRNQKTQRAQRGREKLQQLSNTRDKTRDERAEKRRARLEQEQQHAELQKKRDAAIQDRDRQRDHAELNKVRKWRETQDKKQLELEAAKMQKRLAEKEAAQKAQEDSLDKNKQWQQLEAKRLEQQEKKDAERVQREKQRREQLQGAK